MTKTNNVKEVTILDFNTHLFYAEEILKKYIDFTPYKDFYNDNLLYHKVFRLPITDRSIITNEKDISDKPFHPILAAMLLKNIALMMIRDENPNRKAIFYNELLGTIKPVYDMSWESSLDIYTDMFNGITEDDYTEVTKLLSKPLDEILNIINVDNEAIYSLDIESKFIILKRHENILAYRYTEALEVKHIMDDIEQENEVYNGYN